MDILKKPIITKAARALVCLFALLALIGAIVTIASSARAANMLLDSSSYTEALSIINSFTGAAAMARAMSIVCFILSLCTVGLAYFSQDNFMISIGAAVASLIQFIMGLVLSPLCSIMGVAKLGLSGKDSGSYLPVLIVLMIMAIAVGICNVLGILKNSSNIPLFQGIQQKVNNAMAGQQQPNMMGQPMYQQPVPQPTQAQQYQQPAQAQQYQQPVPQPAQAQQPYPQPVPQPAQAQQPYQQPVPQPTQPQQYQQGVPQPTQPQQYQQPNDFNHQ